MPFNKKSFAAFGFVAIAILGVSYAYHMNSISRAPAAAKPTETQAIAKDLKVGDHQFLIVGDRTVYLVHISMSMAPHDNQAIFEAKMTKKDGSDAMVDIIADRNKAGNADRFYNLAFAQPFVLSSLLPGTTPTDMTGARLAGFTKGEKDPSKQWENLMEDVTVHFERVVFYQHYLLEGAEPLPKTNSYIVFGDGSSTFAMPLINVWAAGAMNIAKLQTTPGFSAADFKSAHHEVRSFAGLPQGIDTTIHINNAPTRIMQPSANTEQGDSAMTDSDSGQKVQYQVLEQYFPAF